MADLTSHLLDETQRLIRSWEQHAPGHLRDYLASGVEDPRINLQSILTRHFLLASILPETHGPLMVEELRFSAAMNWLGHHSKDLAVAEHRRDILHALRCGADNADGLPIPACLIQLFARLPVQAGGVSVPNYVERHLSDGGTLDTLDTLDTFEQLWAEVLSGESPTANHVLEPACGSANDYRCLDRYGIARLIRYSGFDLCEKNVTNARSLFPAAQFEMGNVFAMPAANNSFELCFVHDLFEHLSPEALQVAVSEICRVARQGLCVGFFQMDEIPEHIIRPLAEYHWNILSMARMKSLFAENGFVARCLHIGTFQRDLTGFTETHNPNAYTFLAVRA